jgi:phosphoadenosine phosphosulfate reductase
LSKEITYATFDETHIETVLINHRDELSILKWAYQEYQDDIVYACSFGAEGIVLIDLIHKVNQTAKIIFLDTGLHFPETYELIEQVKKHYPTLQITLVKPKSSLDDQAKWYGDELWNHNPNLCCHLRKVVPLQEALQPVTAWISGLRREQSPSRSQTQYINKDDKFKKVKICPLIHWTWNDVLTYIELNELPYNPLHDKGYPSIGCAPCTKPVSSHQDLRSGRWSGTQKTECGLHVNQE